MTQKPTPITPTSADLTAERLAHLRDLFPEAFTEGKVDFAKLRAALGEAVDDRPERYSFGWAGKSEAIRLLQTPTAATLLPAPHPQATVDNPNEFAAQAVRIIKEKLSDQLIAGIQYEKINDWYQMELLADELKAWEEHLVKSDGRETSLYDQVIVDSEVERRFVQDLEQREDIKLYLKLPDWFKVPTPIGHYNPDWAIVMQDEHDPAAERLYLVSETKGAVERDTLRGAEAKKIECGRAHFEGALGVQYKVVDSAAGLVK